MLFIQHTVKHYFSPHLNLAIFLCGKCILIWQIFQLILFSSLFPVSFGVSTNFTIKIPIVLLFTLHITKNIAYHIMEVLIFYAHKLMMMGNSKNPYLISQFYSNCENLMLAKYTCFIVLQSTTRKWREKTLLSYSSKHHYAVTMTTTSITLC